MNKATVSILLALFWLVQSGLAQDYLTSRSRTKGLSGAISMGYLSYTSDELHQESQSGWGFGLNIEYGLTHRLAFDLSFQRFSVNSGNSLVENSPYPFYELELAGKFYFAGSDQRLRPYLGVGVNYSRQNEEFYDEYDNFNDVVYNGFAVLGRGGLGYYPSENWRVEGDFSFDVGSFSNILVNREPVDDSYSFYAWKTRLGIRYFF
ncbi:MAG: outer membrane beta-barrel protein [Saprospiraceae bacterium]|nr:outer membrane beta-barrel protein [Saprospiraceae bacterium]